MLMASRAVLDHMKLSASKLFLGGRSQGGFVTITLLEKPESAGGPVATAAPASAPLDGYVALSGDGRKNQKHAAPSWHWKPNGCINL